MTKQEKVKETNLDETKSNETVEIKPVETVETNLDETKSDETVEIKPIETVETNLDETKSDEAKLVEKPKSYKSEATALMKRLNVNLIYRTLDGQWFTNIEYANTHAKKVGGEAKVYKLEGVRN